MRYDAVIYLLTVAYTKDDLKQQTKTYSKRKVYANKFMIGAAEFSAAGQIGLTPELEFQLNSIEYQGEAYVEYNDERYHVYRSQVSGDKTLLYLAREVADDGN